MAKTAQSQLVAIFNTDNPSLAQALTDTDVTFGAVAEYAPADETDTRNTNVSITAVEDSTHFTGTKELHYTRLAASVVGAKAVTDDQADWDADDEVLAFLNADVISAGKPDDSFVASELELVRTDGENGEKIITIAIKAGHLKYLPGTLATYTITQEVQKTDLSSTNGELNGF